MADTRTLTIRQTIHRPHHETVVRRWYDVIERTITREIAPDGSITAEEIAEEIVERRENFEEETLETLAEDDEVVAESVSDEA